MKRIIGWFQNVLQDKLITADNCRVVLGDIVYLFDIKDNEYTIQLRTVQGFDFMFFGNEGKDMYKHEYNCLMACHAELSKINKGIGNQLDTLQNKIQSLRRE